MANDLSSYIKAAGGGASPSGFSGLDSYLQAAQATNTPESQKLYTYAKQDEVTTQAARQANSFSGILKNTVSDIGSKIKGYAQAGANTVVPFGNALFHPIDTVYKIGDAFRNTEQNAVQSAGSGLADLFIGKGTPAKIAGAANLLSGTAGALFSPITGTFQVAEKVPGLKQVADAFNVPFTVAGVAGAYSTGKFVDILPIDQESKDILKEPLKQVGSLAAQILLGGRLMKGVEELSKRGQTITPAEAKKIVVQSTSETNQIPINTPNTRHAAYAQSQGYEPYIANEKLPSFQVGSVPKSTSIQTEAPVAGQIPGLKYEPIKTTPTEAAPTETVPVKVARSQGETVAPNTGDTTSKVGADLKAKAIAQGLTGDFEAATFSTKTIEGQKQAVGDLIANNPELANKMANGKAPIPPDINKTMLLRGLTNEAIANNDVNALRDLAKSPIASAISKSAQDVRFAQELNDSPIKTIADVQKAREANLETQNGQSITKQTEKIVSTESKSLETEIKKTATKQSWDEFVKSIECGY